MDKTKLIDYLQDRSDLYLSMSEKARAKDNYDLSWAYLLVVDVLDRLIFIVNSEHEEEK